MVRRRKCSRGASFGGGLAAPIVASSQIVESSSDLQQKRRLGPAEIAKCLAAALLCLFDEFSVVHGIHGLVSKASLNRARQRQAFVRGSRWTWLLAAD